MLQPDLLRYCGAAPCPPRWADRQSRVTASPQPRREKIDPGGLPSRWVGSNLTQLAFHILQSLFTHFCNKQKIADFF